MLRMTYPIPNRGCRGEKEVKVPSPHAPPCHPRGLWMVPATPTPSRSPVSLQETQQLGQNAPPDAHPHLIIWKLLQCIKEGPLGVFSHLLLHF